MRRMGPAGFGEGSGVSKDWSGARYCWHSWRSDCGGGVCCVFGGVGVVGMEMPSFLLSWRMSVCMWRGGRRTVGGYRCGWMGRSFFAKYLSLEVRKWKLRVSQMGRESGYVPSPSLYVGRGIGGL